MKFSLSLLDQNSDIKLAILNNLKEELDKALNKTIADIDLKLKSLVKQALQNEPEYNSLMSGELRKEFGIADTSNIDIAIDNLINSIIIEKNPLKIGFGGLSGGITLKIIPNDFTGTIDDSSAVVVDNVRGYSLPWLEWLLLRGGEIIVRDFEVKYGPNPASRSGDAIMISSKKNWRVPSQFSGTVRNNWVTRALSTLDEKIPRLIQASLESNL